MSKFFHPLEFKACTPSCDISLMDSEFLAQLDELRSMCGFPLVLNCAYRSPEWDKERGRSGNSWHTKGLAVDIRCYDAQKRALIVRFALELGLSVGVYSSFVHIDARPNYMQVCFYGISYGSVSAPVMDQD